MLTFFDQLTQHAILRPEHTAIVTDSYSLNYAELLRRVEAGHSYLRTIGVGPEARVGVSISDEVEHLLASLSLLATGAGQIILATHDSQSLKSSLSQRLRITHVLSTNEKYKVEDAAFMSWPEQKSTRAAKSILKPSVSSATLYLRTSGTTGDSNLVPLSEEQIALQSVQHPEYADERVLRLASIEHNNSKRHRLYAVWAGGTNVFHPEGNFDIIDFALRHNVTCIDITRMHASDLAAAENASKLSCVKIRTAGSSVPREVRQSVLDKLSKNLHVRYGATECGSISSAMPGEHDAEETSGRPFDGVNLQIVGPNDDVLPTGHTGEIRVQTPGMATRYHDSPGDSAKRFRKGWFYPGDLGCLRADGQLIVKGRKDDMIILNGINIFPSEIEKVLESHPRVKAAAALALPSKVHGQIPVAAVELHPGNTVSASELHAFAREHLALRAPRRILVLSRLPRNSQEKILKREIRASFGQRISAS